MFEQQWQDVCRRIEILFPGFTLAHARKDSDAPRRRNKRQNRLPNRPWGWSRHNKELVKLLICFPSARPPYFLLLIFPFLLAILPPLVYYQIASEAKLIPVFSTLRSCCNFQIGGDARHETPYPLYTHVLTTVLERSESMDSFDLHKGFVVAWISRRTSRVTWDSRMSRLQSLPTMT